MKQPIELSVAPQDAKQDTLDRKTLSSHSPPQQCRFKKGIVSQPDVLERRFPIGLGARLAERFTKAGCKPALRFFASALAATLVQLRWFCSWLSRRA